MLALIQVNCQLKNISPRDFFRSAYMRRFSKDIPAQSLNEDVDDFEKRLVIPKYVVDYIVSIYGETS